MSHSLVATPLAGPTRPRRTARRMVAAVALAAAATVALPLAAASAHVRVTPTSTASGSYSELTFRVPNEEAGPATTKLSITLPTTDPFTFVSVRPVPGWTATVTETTLATPITRDGTTLTKAPSLVTWTADAGGGIKQDQYDNFSIIAGPLPAAGQLELPATQTYSDGKVVNWDEHQAPGATEPENPAPSFVVTAATGGDPDDDSSSATPSASATTPSTTATTITTVASGSTSGGVSGSDPVARGLSIAALVVAVLGSGGAFFALRRRGASGSSS